MFNEKASQREVFEKITPDLFQSFVAGENVCIFAYGQTGSGKTHRYFLFFDFKFWFLKYSWTSRRSWFITAIYKSTVKTFERGFEQEKCYNRCIIL